MIADTHFQMSKKNQAAVNDLVSNQATYADVYVQY